MPYMVTKKQDARLDGFLFDIVDFSSISTIFVEVFLRTSSIFCKKSTIFRIDDIDFEKNRFLGTKIDIRR
jgi:hypothetical protein